jgi:hypothetical protein
MGHSPIQVNTVKKDNGVEHAYEFVSQTVNNIPIEMLPTLFMMLLRNLAKKQLDNFPM